MPRLAWPERFSVTIEPVAGTGSPLTLEVVTWLHAEKAVAIAVREYVKRYEDSDIYDVRLHHQGRATRLPDGTFDIEGALVDRHEW